MNLFEEAFCCEYLSPVIAWPHSTPTLICSLRHARTHPTTGYHGGRFGIHSTHPETKAFRLG